MFPQKIAVLWKEVCAFRCLEEPAEILVEVPDDKVGKLIKGVERLSKKVLLQVITGKELSETKDSGQNLYDMCAHEMYTNLVEAET